MMRHMIRPTPAPYQTYDGVETTSMLVTRSWSSLTCRTSFLYVLGSFLFPKVCFRNASSTETMILVSNVSLKVMKKTWEASVS